MNWRIKVEAFEKTWEKNGGGVCGKANAESYWRQAMEHMLTISDNKCCFITCIVHKAIKQELED